jgi:hypothetical protein
VTGYLLLAWLWASLDAQTPAAVRLYPVDDASREPAFRSYVSKLQSAVESRNTKALRKLVDDEVVVGPEKEDKGWKKFVERWRPDDRETTPLWTALSDCLALGFVREHPHLFLSPYLVWRFPRELDPRTHLVVVRDKVILRESPSLTSPALATLSFDIVRQLSEEERGDGLARWYRVRTTDSKTGYVNSRDVMSPLMPRAQFGTREGRWVLIGLEQEQ